MLGLLSWLGGALGKSAVGGLLSRTVGAIRSPVISHLVVAALAIGGALYVDHKFDEAARAGQLEDALKEQEKAVARAIAQERAMRAIDDEVVSGYIQELEDIRANPQVLEKEVVKYVRVPENGRDCNLTVGAVGLLNRERTGVPDPATARLTDAEKQAPSAVDQRQEVRAHAQCGRHYREMAAQHDALVEWIERQRELHEKQ